MLHESLTLSLDDTHQTVNTYTDGQRVTFRNANGETITATVTADRGGDRVKVKDERGFSHYVQRELIQVVNPTTRFTCDIRDFSLDALHAAYRAAGMEGTPVPPMTVGIGAHIPCNIHFVIGRGYVECGR